MTKNIKVTDENGNIIGYTYPKRVKGLVKNGRAELVGDCEIRLTDRCSTEIENSEDINMNIINFNAREFKFDQRCDGNVGSRVFITDDFGERTSVQKTYDSDDDACHGKNPRLNHEIVFSFLSLCHIDT